MISFSLGYHNHSDVFFANVNRVLKAKGIFVVLETCVPVRYLVKSMRDCDRKIMLG